jgi:hypothetical protein
MAHAEGMNRGVIVSVQQATEQLSAPIDGGRRSFRKWNRMKAWRDLNSLLKG